MSEELSEELTTNFILRCSPAWRARLSIMASAAERSESAQLRFLLDQAWRKAQLNPTLHPADLNPGMPIDCNPT